MKNIYFYFWFHFKNSITKKRQKCEIMANRLKFEFLKTYLKHCFPYRLLRWNFNIRGKNVAVAHRATHVTYAFLIFLPSSIACFARPTVVIIALAFDVLLLFDRVSRLFKQIYSNFYALLIVICDLKFPGCDKRFRCRFGTGMYSSLLIISNARYV